jgi:uncharacterized protein (TIRG00374 family)
MLPGFLRLGGKKVPNWLIPAVGYAISVACLIWVFRGVDRAELRANIRDIHWRWVVVAVCADIGTYIFQAWRWNLLLNPVVRPSLWRSVQAIYVGLFANELFPLRPGEVIRCFLQARWSKLPFSVAFSSVVIERIFDGIWLVLVFAVSTVLVGTHSPLPRWLIEGGKVLGVVTLGLALVLGLVMFRKHHAHAAVSNTRWAQHLRVLVEDLHLMGNSPSFYAAAGVSSLYLLIQVIPVYALMQGFKFDLSIGAATVVMIIWRLGTVLPQAPGNVGSSQALLVMALGLFGVEKADATSFSVMTWLVITLPLLLAGFIALAITDMKLGELRRHAHSMATPAAVSGETGGR